MKVILLIWITLLMAVPHGLTAQQGDGQGQIDYNYNRYRQTFEKEIEGTKTPGEEVNAANSFIYSPVPDWLFQPLKTSYPVIQAFGISDPGLDSSIARSQAASRAIYIASLMSNTAVSNLVDNYAEDAQKKTSQVSGQYVDYFELTSSNQLDISDVRVVQEEFTSFGECIVMVEIPSSSTEKPVSHFKTVGMLKEFEKDGAFECNSRIELTARSPEMQSRYVSRSVGGLIDVESYMDDNQLILNTNKLKYKQYSPSEKQSIQGAPADRGLWNAYLTAVLKALTVELRLLPAQMKSTSDNYPGKTEILNREATGGNLTFRINQVFINNNKVWAILDQFNFTQP
jgi:hypothetical protein